MGYRNILLDCCEELDAARKALSNLSRTPTEGGSFGKLSSDYMRRRFLEEIAKAREALLDLERIVESDM